MKITYDSKSFMLDGRRIWITAGEVHYFRHPSSEWEQVLTRAKRAGLNAISTYVPWNFHETHEGTFDFTGDRDLGRYIDLIGDMGMYAMLRPGPYICSEWDGGGIPSWLCAKPVKRFREDDPVYMDAVEKWFGRLLPIISQRQITKGGPVITVQNENEYPGGWDESMIRYIRRINDLFARHGINVPILACNVHGASKTDIQINFTTDERDQYIDPSMILTYNHHLVVEPVYELRKRQPNAPLIVTEFWCGEPVYWGKRINYWPHHLLQAQAAYEYASVGAQVCYYMFEGGTNFGFFGGNNIATSYASSYPVGEGGKLTEKYYAVRPANLFASQFGELLAESVERTDRQGIRHPENVRLVVRECSKGSLVFVSTRSRQKDIDLILPGERSLTVHLGQVAASVVPLKLEVFDGVVVDYGNLALLAREASRRALILFGPAGTDGVISIGGNEEHIPVCRGRVLHREIGGANVIVVDEEMARRCWIVDDEVVFGPDYVAGKIDGGALDIHFSDAISEIVHLGADGRPVSERRSCEKRHFNPPKLGSWDMVTCAEVDPDEGTGWIQIDGPRSHERLGVVLGYCWYRAEIECEEDGVEKMLLVNTPNRVSVFANGRFVGTHGERRWVRMRDEYGHPADWSFEELTVQVRKGRNTFVFLSDDLGHNYDVPCPVGIQGPVFLGSRMMEIKSYRELPSTPVSGDALNFLYSREYRELRPLPAIEFDLPLRDEERAFICIHGVHAWITANGNDVLPLSYPDSPWTMFEQIKRWVTWQLPENTPGKRKAIRVQYVSDTPGIVAENIVVYVVPKSGELANWSWKPWEPRLEFDSVETVKDSGTGKDSPLVLVPAGSRLMRKGRLLAPSFFAARFPMPEGDLPVFLRIGQLQKGQIYLNGHNAGRFWKLGGTQELYYLPRSWMREENQLVIFEELGFSPQGTCLVFGGDEKH